MPPSHKRLLALIAAVPALVVLLAWMYMLGMEHLEDESRTFAESIEWAAETVTSTGYGHDSAWDHPVMIVFVVVVQFSGVFLILMVFPVFVIPFIEERFEGRLSMSVPKLKHYVLIYGYGPEVASLIDDLRRARVPVVILEEDEAMARRLRDRGHRVSYAQLEEDDPDLGYLPWARAIVCNGEDHKNAVLTLSAREQGYEGPVLCMVTEPVRRPPMNLAGATIAFTPLHILAAAMAAKASVKISPRVAGVQPLGRHLEIAELRIHHGSELAGKTLAEAAIRESSGATIIGQWVNGVLEAQPRANTPLEPGTILVAAGSAEAIANLGKIARPIATDGAIVLVGHGNLGGKIAELLTDAGEDVRVVDIVGGPGVDFVGDALDRRVMRDAGIGAARAVILAMGEDSATIFASTMLRDLAPEVPIIASVNRVDNIPRIHRAGADFAMSVSQVAGQILSHYVLGEDAVSLEAGIKVVRVAPGALAGQNPIANRIRERTGCSIVAVERGDDVIVDFGAAFRFRKTDTVYICGTNDAIDDYYEVIADSRAPV